MNKPILVRSKLVIDAYGEPAIYDWYVYQATPGTLDCDYHVFRFRYDSDTSFDLDYDDTDWECESWDEAEEWFECKSDDSVEM